MNTIIQTPTPDILKSKSFYTKMGFTEISDSNCYTDGKSIIEINPERFARPGIKLIASSWTSEVEKLNSLTKVITTDSGFLLGDCTGTWIYLIESETSLTIPENCTPSLMGNNQGITIESIDIEKAANIWNTIGFKTVAGNIEQGWISLVNGDGVVINIMTPNCCPHLFLNPSISFFNGTNNQAIIEKIRATEIEIKEEITHFSKENTVDNIIMADPGNIGFFIFND
jgi:predicted lactoylglutathione lyase